jgi:hypothetical protein
MMATLVPLTSDSDGLREWDITTPDGTYYIKDDMGDWTLYKLVGPSRETDWEEIGTGPEIDAFLKQHNLTLAQ